MGIRVWGLGFEACSLGLGVEGIDFTKTKQQESVASAHRREKAAARRFRA